MSTVIAHRLSALEDSNSEIKQQLELMLEIGRRNEEKFLWLKSFILKLLEVQGFAQLDQVIFHQLIDFTHVNHVMLFLRELHDPGELLHIKSVKYPDRIHPRLFELQKTLCETCREEEYHNLFGVSVGEPPSVALVPINYPSHLGTLAIGSADHAKFNVDVDTLFLDFLGEVIARVIVRLQH